MVVLQDENCFLDWVPCGRQRLIKDRSTSSLNMTKNRAENTLNSTRNSIKMHKITHQETFINFPCLPVDKSVKLFWRIEVRIISANFLFVFLSARIISYFPNYGLFRYFHFNVRFFFQMKFILFLLTVVVLLNQYMFARSLICDRISEDSRYFPCQSHDNTGFLDQFVPLPFIRSKKLGGNRKKFQSRHGLNILRPMSGSIERYPGPMQNHIGKALPIQVSLKSIKPLH